MWKQVASTVAACALSMAQAPRSNAQIVYDLAQDFSLASNPNGVWSYGIFAPGAINPASFSLSSYPHTTAGSQGMLDLYSYAQNGDIFNLNPPYVSHNPLNSLTVLSYPGGDVIYQPHEAGMHPGLNGEYSVARFTAPATADLYLATTYSSIDFGQGTTTDVHVWKNSASLFDSEVNPGTSTAFAPASPIHLVAGDAIYFIVGFGANNNYFYDSTGVSATFSTSPVPEPSSLCLFGVAFAVIGGTRKRRKRRGGATHLLCPFTV
jgi:PEP-CTERM motif-containing protein